MNSTELKEMKSRIKILENFLIAVAIIGLSSLPYIHDVITVRGEGLKGWVPDWGLQQLLTDSTGRILGFSSYRVFIYTLLLHLFAHIGYTGWFFEASGKLYRPFILVPVILSMYQIGIILFNWRSSAFNQPNTKIIITIVLSLFLAYNFYFNNKKMIKNHLKKTKLNNETESTENYQN